MEDKEGKYLMFYLNEECYGIPILKVNEIIGIMDITHVPRTPNYMKGIINLRGKVIPIMDIRLKFNMAQRAYDEQTCIIILELPINDHKNFVGIVVDKVAEVIKIDQENIQPPPKFTKEGEEDIIIGVGKFKDKVVMLLGIETIINIQKVLESFNEIQKEAAKEQTEKEKPIAEVVEEETKEEKPKKSKAK